MTIDVVSHQYYHYSLRNIRRKKDVRRVFVSLVTFHNFLFSEINGFDFRYQIKPERSHLKQTKTVQFNLLFKC